MTSSITLQKCTRYVIITRRKPLLFSILRSPMLRFSAHFLDNLEYKTLHIDMDYGNFVLRDFSAKQSIKNMDFLAMKNRTRQTGE